MRIPGVQSIFSLILIFLLLSAGTARAEAQTPVKVVTVPLRATALAYDATKNRLYATTGSDTSLERANSLVTIDPGTGRIEKSVYMGSSEPRSLSVSAQGRYVYVGLGRLFRQYDAARQTAGPYVTWDGGGYLKRIYPHPTDPEAAVVLLGDRNGYLGSEAAVLSNGKLLPARVKAAGDFLLPTVSPYNFYIGCRAACKVVSDGVQVGWATEQDVPLGEISIAGVGINSSGFVYDVETREEIGHLANNVPNMNLAADAKRGVVLRQDNGKVIVYDLQTYQPVREVLLPEYPSGRNLLRWGDDGLAFTTDKEIVLVRADWGPILPVVDLVLARSPLQGKVEPGKTVSYRLTVRNNSKQDCAAAFLTDKLPGGIEVSRVAASQGVATATGSLLRGALGRIPVGKSVTVDVEFLITTPAPLAFYGVVRAYEPDPVGENNLSLYVPSR